MLNENAKAWVAALRSGEYKQGRRVLKSEGRYCCLGVACELAVKAEIIPPSVDESIRGYAVYDGAEYSLPILVQQWLGLRTECGDYKIDVQACDLTKDNDTEATFAEIADIIESEPEGLFMPEEPAAGAVAAYTKLTKEELGQ